MSAVKNVGAASFAQETASGVVLVDFWAAWCGPCRMVAPVLDEVAVERPALKIIKVNVDEEPVLSGRFGVRSIPTLVVLKDGHEVMRLVGYTPKDKLLAQIAPVLG